MNRESFLILIYNNLRDRFSGLNSNHWIWVDYFQPINGFTHFVRSLNDDKEFYYLKDEQWYKNRTREECEDLANDIASEIQGKLSKNDFLSNCQQEMLR